MIQLIELGSKSESCLEIDVIRSVPCRNECALVIVIFKFEFTTLAVQPVEDSLRQVAEIITADLRRSAIALRNRKLNLRYHIVLVEIVSGLCANARRRCGP